jgi:hypothetical protein
MPTRYVGLAACAATLEFSSPTSALMRWCGVFLAGLLVVVRLPVAAQSAVGVQRFPTEPGTVSISGTPRPGFFLASEGQRAAAFGDETGTFEVWAWPLKLVRDLHVDFKLAGSEETISGAAIARQVTATPEGVLVVYSNPAFTVRARVFVPVNEPGALVLLQVETARTLDVLVRFHADFNVAWPGSVLPTSQAAQGDRKAFVFSDLQHQANAIIGSPLAASVAERSGRDVPVGESEIVLRVESGQATTDVIPIAMAGGIAPRDSVAAAYQRLLGAAPAYWRDRVERYRRIRVDQLTIDSPDSRMDATLEWSKANLDQQLVCVPDLGCGAVAGFARTVPGSFRAPNFSASAASLGALALGDVGASDGARQALTFFAQYQRADGRIPSDVSMSAKRVAWFTEYAQAWQNAVATPLWLRGWYEYWLASGDTDLLRKYWPNITRAFAWSVGTDVDGDGLMNSSRAGAGAFAQGALARDVREDIHVAGVWLAALEGTEQMARSLGDDSIARAAAAALRRASQTVEAQFWSDSTGQYSYALLESRRVARALTSWPAAAMAFGFLDPDRSNRMLREIGSSAVTADWGVRALSARDAAYDPLNPGYGAITALNTGLTALAHYRYHRSWSGYDLVRDIARTTSDFARGRNPDALSGAFYQTLDASEPQSSVATTMFVEAFVRGLLGLEADVPHRALGIEPHLPAEWNQLVVENFRVGRDRVSVRLRRDAGVFSVHLRRVGTGAALSVRLSPALPLGAHVERITVNEQDFPVRVDETRHDVHPVVELSLTDEADVDIDYAGGAEIIAPAERVDVGQGASALHVIDFTRQGQDYLVDVEGLAGTTYGLQVRTGGRAHVVAGAEVLEQTDQRLSLRLTMPAGAGYVRREVRFRL